MIKLIVLDVDGTLTDGRLYMDDKDNCLKAFDVKDGFAIAQWIKLGGIVAIITGKTSKIVKRRKEELGIQELAQGISNKVKELNKLLNKYSLLPNEVAYIGDDINDLGIINKVGFSACPKDAAPEVVERVTYVANKNGGKGAVREIFEKLMKENNMWDEVLKRYINEN
ncbi:3-deoxy-D-manno-octulosonate 8-phosphate phosphatase KdsC [Fusobacterium necrogenes]|uniref:3-deoxy-D-manno-octulosonate 8-phosphate phosphatase KdsC n=1 Tax=Fusobacterium necrogenes TaxID=858 RepID=A0A377GXV8_9FUSO|nr:HAD-IIIA family hydrolase [Fusobacterium necrogenes]STO31683.1 3-deoxy-D-manno-octulosonate 8-phosphate phosphatase KdsC [Fusobacterium necrogenes]